MNEARLAELDDVIARMRPMDADDAPAWPHGEIPVFRRTYENYRDLVAEIRRVRSVLNDLLLTRQAQEDACGEHFDLLLADDGSPEDAQRCEEACGREAKATVAHLAAWDRARSLLAGEEKP